MKSWLKIVLLGVGGFSSGAGAIAGAGGDDMSALVAGAVAAGNAIAALFIRSPKQTHEQAASSSTLRAWIILATLLGAASIASAQTNVTPTPTTRVAWEAGDNWAAVGVTGQRMYVDGVLTNLGQITPDAAGVYSVPFPALTPGDHTIEIAAFNAGGEGERAALAVRVVILPSGARNLRIVVARWEPATGWRDVLEDWTDYRT